MKRNTSGESYWNVMSAIYDRVMRKDANAYRAVAERIKQSLKRGENVLEIATGTGLIALSIADSGASIQATDYSEGMIFRASTKEHPHNVSFSVQDACALGYQDKSFDAVIISNALHIMPNPEKALENVKRVLKDDGVLFAPNFMHIGSFKTSFLAAVLRFAGLKTYSRWNPATYSDFLGKTGWKILESDLIPASIPICYIKAEKNNRGS
jgi:ubiquinone/menaquinone biosynthesis C-methylase UbiE